MTTKSDGTAAATIQLAPDSGAPGRAREFLTRFVCAEGAEQYAEDGRVVVSELVTNAVRYSRTEMAVDLELTGAGLEVGVYDDGPGQPRITPATRRELGGRGLVLVARLAHEWGVQFAERGGKRVWCMLTDRVHGEAGKSGDDVIAASARQSSPRPIPGSRPDGERLLEWFLTSVVLAVVAVVPRRRRGPPRPADSR